MSPRASDKQGKGAAGGMWAGWKKPLAWTLLAMAAAAAAGYGMTRLEGRLLTQQARRAPLAVRVELAGIPAWMPQALAGQIAAAMLPPGASYYDRDLTDAVRLRAERDPWVRRILRVEKYPSGEPGVAVVEVQAEYRVPAVSVRVGPTTACVDTEGVRLPEQQVPRWASIAADGSISYYLDRGDVPRDRRFSRIHYIVIDGVAAVAPPVGQRWPGDDLAAGLRLAALVGDKPYAYQITAIDVRNHGGRIDGDEPHLRMYAQRGGGSPTDIRFGRFPMDGGDYVVSPQRKMSYLDEYVRRNNGQLAGLNRYLDLRYDELHVSYN